MRFGFKIIENPHVPCHRKWIFPKDRFVEWGPEDESYCRFAGFGHEQITYESFRLGDTLVLHPSVAKELRRQIKLPFLGSPRVIINFTGF